MAAPRGQGDGRRTAHPCRVDPQRDGARRKRASRLSPDTELRDRSTKFARYQAIDTFTDYILVATSEIRVEHFSRQADGAWLLRGHNGGETVRIASLDLSITVDELYARYEDARRQDEL